MTQVLVTESYLDDIADAIRRQNGSNSTYTPAQMAAAIEAIGDVTSVNGQTGAVTLSLTASGDGLVTLGI